jgi:DNA-binding MarR family transcriptional regulator
MASDQTQMRTADRESAVQEGGNLKLRLWLRVLTCMQLIETSIRSRLRTEFDTTLPRFDVLAQLDAATDSLSMGELSARLMVTSGSVTGLVDTMETEQLVERRAHPADRRSTLISMTPRGRALFDRMAPAHAAWVEELMAGLSAAEAATLHRLLGKLKQSASEAGSEMRLQNRE